MEVVRSRRSRRDAFSRRVFFDISKARSIVVACITYFNCVNFESHVLKNCIYLSMDYICTYNGLQNFFYTRIRCICIHVVGDRGAVTIELWAEGF